MYKFICLFALVAIACAATIRKTDDEEPTEKKEYEIVPVLKFENNHKPDGSFSFMYEGGDQSYRQETGVVENAGTDDEALEVTGSYRYIDADGREVEVHYTAGRNGFVPVGTNILSEISTLAKAAADLPDNTVEEETRRKARSKGIEKDEEENIPAKIAKVAKVATAEAKPIVAKVKNVQKVKEEHIPVEIVKEPKVETKPTEAKVETVKKAEEVPKVTKVAETKATEAKEESAEKPTKVEKAEKTGRSAETPKEEKTDKTEKSDKAEKPDKTEKSKIVKTAPEPVSEEKKPAKKPTTPTKA